MPGIVAGMPDYTFKVRENLARRMASRQGLRLEKCPRRDPRAFDHGTYQLVDAFTGAVHMRGLPTGYGMTLDDVERVLTADQPLLTVPRQLVRSGG